jgi:putative RNA 2'-phosphotransferase
MKRVSHDQLSRLVSHALRHQPWFYELELDEAGWVQLDALLAAIHQEGAEWAKVDRRDLEIMIAGAAKQRHEIYGGRIRALYGHSTPRRIVKVAAYPPPVLYHGTSVEAWLDIQRQGLSPMGRQYVHLSVDVETAEQVGRRKSSAPVIIEVDAIAAVENGTQFWRGNASIWLSDQVAAAHLSNPARRRSTKD